MINYVKGTLRTQCRTIFKELTYLRCTVHGIAGFSGLDCWIEQFGLQSDLVDWIVIDND